MNDGNMAGSARFPSGLKNLVKTPGGNTQVEPKTKRRRTVTGQEREMNVMAKVLRLLVPLSVPSKLRIIGYVSDALRAEANAARKAGDNGRPELPDGFGPFVPNDEQVDG